MENEWTKRIEELEAENARLARDNKVCVELNDKLVAEIARIEDRVSEEYEAERADDRAKIKELEDERDGYRNGQQQVQDLLAKQIDSNLKLAAALKDKPDQSDLDAVVFRINYLEAENRRLREALDLVISFIPDGWEMPLGWSDLVAQVRGKDEPL